MTENRDQELAGALATLDVPPHRAGFWDELEQRLMPDRIERQRERHQPELHELATDTSHIRRGSVASSRRGRWVLAAAAVLLVIAATAAVLVLRPGGRDGREEVATVAEITGAVTDRLATLRTLHGTLELTSFDGVNGTETYEFWRSSNGSYRIEYSDGEVTTYNFTTGTLMTSMLTETGSPVGPPDALYFGSGLLEEEVTVALQAARSMDGVTVHEDNFEGRPAWLLETPVTPNLLGSAGSIDRIAVVIDQEVLVPLEVTKFSGDRTVDQFRFRDLAVDDPLPPGIFSAPQADDVVTQDLGFRRVATPQDSPADQTDQVVRHASLEASAEVGYDAPVPASVPEGYSLAGVAWAAEERPTGPEGGNPPSVDVITLLYTRGFEWFAVSTRRVGEGIWDDPLGGEGLVQDPESVNLGRGRLAGVEAQVSVTQPFVPHLWAVGDQLVLTVAGNLTADELVDVAEAID